MDGSGRFWLILFFAILAVAGGASVWLVANDPGPAPAAVAALPPPPPAAPPPTPAVAAPPPAPPAPPAIVDSAERRYPMAQWRIGQNVGGWIDALGDTEAPLADGAILDISGWAGDSDLGWRARNVLLAVCGEVVASVKVDRPRPDVARAAHPNLAQSGWRARLAVAHLPRCAEPRQQALAQLGDGRFALPLMGARALALAPAGGAKPALLAPPAPLAPPAADPEPRALRLSGTANVRSCAAATCEQRGQLAAGSYRAHVLEESGDWLLVSVPQSGIAGWILRRLVAAR